MGQTFFFINITLVENKNCKRNGLFMVIPYTTCCPSLWQVLIYQLQYQKIAFNIDFLFVTFLVFPAWEPSSNDVLCAKFLYFYRSKCFDKNVEEKITKKIVGKRDAERLQRITNSSDVFTNLFHEFFLQIFLNLSC